MTHEEHSTFDTNIYTSLRADAVGAGGPMQKRGATLARIMDVLGTARVNAQLTVDALRTSGVYQEHALKRAKDARDDVSLALALLQQAAREGSL